MERSPLEGLVPILAEERDDENPNCKVCDSTENFVRQKPWYAPSVEQLADLQSHNVKAEQSDGHWDYSEQIPRHGLVESPNERNHAHDDIHKRARNDELEQIPLYADGVGRQPFRAQACIFGKTKHSFRGDITQSSPRELMRQADNERHQ